MNPAPKIVVEFSEPEARALLAMLDAAVKSLGMQAAEAGVVLTKLVAAALQEASKPQPNPGLPAAPN